MIIFVATFVDVDSFVTWAASGGSVGHKFLGGDGWGKPIICRVNKVSVWVV